MNGNPTVLAWILEKWEANGYPLEVDTMDSQGYSPLYLVCYRGFQGAAGINGSTAETKKKRLECATILIQHGADINFMTPKLRMTPLHWAAYHNDEKMVEFLQ